MEKISISILVSKVRKIERPLVSIIGESGSRQIAHDLSTPFTWRIAIQKVDEWSTRRSSKLESRPPPPRTRAWTHAGGERSKREAHRRDQRLSPRSFRFYRFYRLQEFHKRPLRDRRSWIRENFDFYCDTLHYWIYKVIDRES